VPDTTTERPAWQTRVILEKQELDERMRKLVAFFDTPQYNLLETEDRLLLIAQHTHMRALSDTLGTRIARFKSPVPASSYTY
jgi:hypothetical protein